MTSVVQEQRSIVLLGSTGSIGTQAIDVIQRNRDRFRVKALSAGGGNLDVLARQALELEVEFVGVAAADGAVRFEAALREQATRRSRRCGCRNVIHAP